MAQSLKARFNGNTQEVLEYTANFGRWKAMTKYGIRSYEAFVRFLADETKNPNYGINPKLNWNGNQNAFDQFIEGIISKITRMETEGREKDKRIEFLEWQLDQKGQADELKILAVIEACK